MRLFADCGAKSADGHHWLTLKIKWHWFELVFYSELCPFVPHDAICFIPRPQWWRLVQPATILRRRVKLRFQCFLRTGTWYQVCFLPSLLCLKAEYDRCHHDADKSLLTLTACLFCGGGHFLSIRGRYSTCLSSSHPCLPWLLWSEYLQRWIRISCHMRDVLLICIWSQSIEKNFISM